MSSTRAIKKPPQLTCGERWMLKLTVVLLLAVGVIGLSVSFQSVSAKAVSWGFETPQLLPAAIDLAIPGFTIAHLLLIRMDMELAWVRAVPWALTVVTVYLNIQAGTTIAAKIGHGALPLVWVVCSEIAGHVYRALIGEATGRRMERIRRSRFIMSPLRTLSLWRRMILWEETSYLSALSREQTRILTRADLRERYGRRWRHKAPIRERALLRIGELTPDGERERLSVSGSAERERPTADPSAPTPEAPTTPSVYLSATGERNMSASATPAHGAGSAQGERPAPASVSALSAERPTVSASIERPVRSRPSATGSKPSAAQVSALTDARSLIVHPLYTALGRRPEWTEIRDALIEAGHAEVSRPTAQRIRERVEKHHPELASIAASALTETPTADAH